MTRKASSRKPRRKAISPLLGAFNRSSAGSGTNPALLRAFIALDALKRGQGTAGLFVELAQLFVVSEKLCSRGYLAEEYPACKAGIDAILRIDKDSGSAVEGWTANDTDYAQLRAAVELLDRQLLVASKEDYRIAEAMMAAYVINS